MEVRKEYLGYKDFLKEKLKPYEKGKPIKFEGKLSNHLNSSGKKANLGLIN